MEGRLVLLIRSLISLLPKREAIAQGTAKEIA